MKLKSKVKTDEKVKIEALNPMGEWVIAPRTTWETLKDRWVFLHAEGVVRYYVYRPTGNVHAFRQAKG